MHCTKSMTARSNVLRLGGLEAVTADMDPENRDRCPGSKDGDTFRLAYTKMLGWERIILGQFNVSYIYI